MVQQPIEHVGRLVAGRRHHAHTVGPMLVRHVGVKAQPGIMAARADRPGLRAAFDYVRDGDVLIVWKLDRLGRSLPHLIETVTSLASRGVGFRSLTEAIDTTTSGGRLVFHLFGALSHDAERVIMRSRALYPERTTA